MTSAVPLSNPPSFRKFNYPDDGFTREEWTETLTWESGQLPPLDREGWHRKKFAVKETGAVFRTQILSIKFVRNSFTQQVRVEFRYSAETWHDFEKKWLPV
jgi:hypothetical protein